MVAVNSSLKIQIDRKSHPPDTCSIYDYKRNDNIIIMHFLSVHSSKVFYKTVKTLKCRRKKM